MQHELQCLLCDMTARAHKCHPGANSCQMQWLQPRLILQNTQSHTDGLRIRVHTWFSVLKWEEVVHRQACTVTSQSYDMGMVCLNVKKPPEEVWCGPVSVILKVWLSNSIYLEFATVISRESLPFQREVRPNIALTVLPSPSVNSSIRVYVLYDSRIKSSHNVRLHHLAWLLSSRLPKPK